MGFKSLTDEDGLCQDCDNIVGDLSLLLDKLVVTKVGDHDQLYLDQHVRDAGTCSGCGYNLD